MYRLQHRDNPIRVYVCVHGGNMIVRLARGFPREHRTIGWRFERNEWITQKWVNSSLHLLFFSWRNAMYYNGIENDREANVWYVHTYVCRRNFFFWTSKQVISMHLGWRSVSVKCRNQESCCTEAKLGEIKWDWLCCVNYEWVMLFLW